MNKIKYLIYYTFIVFIFTALFISSTNIKEYKKIDYTEKKIQKINKIIIIGDSRMELMENASTELNLPNSIIFDAKSGAKIDWFLDSGLNVLNDILKNRDTFRYNYYVILNMGVNDLDSVEDPNVLANNYYKVYSTIVNKYNDVSFKYLSVNPIDENILKTKRTTKGIKKFNKYFENKIKKEKIFNFEYCDSYNSFDFGMPDGLHYDFETNEMIMDFIINYCI